ncbi:TolC family protein [Massilia sp. NP310]|jgi:outer membrane protein, heavy metal efflux system|nr:TolC family protein [Massilia sp. NP310]
MHPRHLIMGAVMLLAQSAPLYAQSSAPAHMLHGAATTTSAVPVSTAEPLPLTLQQALQAAYARNPDLRAASHAIGIADGVRRQAGVIPNPELSLSTEGTDRRSRVETVEISQTIELGGKRGARIAAAEQERQLAFEAVRGRRAELRADVMAAYLEALTVQERVVLAQSSIEIASRATNAATRRVAAGKISPVEQTRSSVAESAVRIELTQATAELAIARRRLAALMGSTATIEQPLVTPELEFAAIPVMAELEQRLASAPRLRQAQVQVSRQDAQVGLERSLRIPDIRISVGSQRDRQRGGATQTLLGLSVPLPLFNRNQGNLSSALQRADQARDELDAERLRLHQALADARQRAEVAQIQLDSLTRDMVPAAQQAYDAAVTGFELGKFGFLDVLDTQRALILARTQYLRALSERYMAATDLERLVPASDAGSTAIFKESMQ